MEITYSDITKYPLTQIAKIDELVIDLGAGKTPVDRLRDLIAATMISNGDSSTTQLADPLLKDVAALISQLSIAQLTLGAIAEGKFPSTDKDPQYAGGVASASSRIFTPQEAAANAVADMKDRD